VLVGTGGLGCAEGGDEGLEIVAHFECGLSLLLCWILLCTFSIIEKMNK